MPMEIVVTTDRWKNDPASRSLVEYLRDHQEALELTDAVLYYDFPAYVDYETAIIRPDVLLFSPNRGFIAVRFFKKLFFKDLATIYLKLMLLLATLQVIYIQDC